MPDRLGLERGTVWLVAADDAWADAYRLDVEQLFTRVRQAPVPPVLFEHIGSTAVPDLVAKPIIDLMAGVHADTEPRRTHHLNLVRAHDSFWRDHVRFGDRE